jgi:hypothetical protein
MTFRIIAAIALLALAATPATSAEWNVDTTDQTKTYTLFAQDTLASGLISMDDRTTCAVTAQLTAGQVVLLVPRPTSSTSHSAEIGNATGVTTSGLSTFTPGTPYFSVQFTSVSQGSISIACSPASGGSAYDDTAIQAEVDANTAGLAGKIDSADFVSFLVSGADGIATATDPNGSVTCAAGANMCLFAGSDNSLWISTSTSAWALVSASGGGADDQVLFHAKSALGAADGAPFECFRRTSLQYLWGPSAGDITCPLQEIEFHTQVTITEVRADVPPSETNALDSTRATSDGCSVCISLDGLACEAGTEAMVPNSAAGDQYVSGSFDVVTPDYVIPAQTEFYLMMAVGDFNFDGGTPTCEFGRGDIAITVKGTFQ